MTVNNGNVTKAQSNDGTFFLSDQASLTLTDVIFDSITSQDAGILHLSSASMANLTRVSASRIYVTGFGGGIFAEGGADVYIRYSTFSEIQAIANGGLLYLGSQSSAELLDSEFTGITALSGGIGWILAGSMTMTRCSVTAVVTTSTGGVVNTLGTTVVTIMDSNLHACQANAGGIVELSGSTTMTIGGTKISSTLANTAGATANADGNAKLVIYNSSVVGGTASFGGEFRFQGSSSLKMTDVNMTGPSSSSIASGVYMSEESRLTVTRCVMNHGVLPSDSLEPAGFVTATDNATAKIENTTFGFNTGRFGASIVARGSASLTVESCQFHDNFAAASGSALYIESTQSTITIRSSNITDNDATVSGGGVFLSGSGGETKLENCHLTSNTAMRGGALRVESGVKAKIISCVFANNNASVLGGAIHVANASVEIQNSTVRANRAGIAGGAVALESPEMFEAIATAFVLNSAAPLSSSSTDLEAKGGAIYIAEVDDNSTKLDILQGSSFVENMALGGAGGAIYYDTENARPTLSTGNGQTSLLAVAGEAVTFTNNQASQGGDIASAPYSAVWSGVPSIVDSNIQVNASINVQVYDYYGSAIVEPTSVTLMADPQGTETATITGGTATTSGGAVCFGSSCSVSANTTSSSVSTTTMVVAPPSSNFTFYAQVSASWMRDDDSTGIRLLNTAQQTLTVQACSPGQVIDPTECRSCDAGYYQPLTPNASSTCLQCPPGRFASSAGSVECTACSDAGGGITAQYGSTACIECLGDNVPNADETQCESCPVNSQTTDNFWECECKIGFFAYEADYVRNNPSSCLDCPPGGSCTLEGLNDTEVLPSNGYWLNPWAQESGSLEFIKCLNEACIGSRSECADGYGGTLCTVCDEGWGRWQRHKCQRCSGGRTAAMAAIVGSWLLVAIVGMMITYVNVKAAEDEIELDEATMDQRTKEEKEDNESMERVSTLVKIVISAVQFNSIAADFKYEWPTFVRAVLVTQRTVGVFGSLLNTDCAQEGASDIRPVYTDTMAMAFAPAAIPILSLLLVAIIYCTHPNYGMHGGEANADDNSRGNSRANSVGAITRTQQTTYGLRATRKTKAHARAVSRLHMRTAKTSTHKRDQSSIDSRSRSTSRRPERDPDSKEEQQSLSNRESRANNPTILDRKIDEPKDEIALGGTMLVVANPKPKTPKPNSNPNPSPDPNPQR
uniref:Tyrosine-protein kinase ephrin type A/B receptor-like domain-containing protein n=1 Tax=Lotharella globosa TaxID=91324 RepID=A0A7S4DM08_9EUKA